MSYDQPRCEICGKFLSNKELDRHEHGDNSVLDSQLIWTGGPIPEPSHKEWWHVKCKDNKKETLT